MRYLMAAAWAALLLSLPTIANAKKADFATTEKLSKWMDGYRAKPEPLLLPAAVGKMREFNLLEDQDKAGIFVGFTAGVLGSNPRMAEQLIQKMLPMPAKDQSIVIRGIAYSGLPNWRELLRKYASKMPDRQKLIDQLLKKKDVVLLDLPLEEGEVTIDTLWGYFFATGLYQPVARIMFALRWSDESDLNKLTIASMAKWSLASNAERDKKLLAFYRSHIKHLPKPYAKPLKEVIAATEDYEASRLRKKLVAAIEVAKAKGPGTSWRGWALEGGQVALAVSCVVAGALGHEEIAVPCVITGALYSGALYLLKKPMPSLSSSVE